MFQIPFSASAAPQDRAAKRTAIRLPFVKIVDAYLFRQVAEATLRGALWFGGLLVVVTVVTAARKVAENAMALEVMLQWIMWQVPRIVLFTLPMSVLYGTVQAFVELSGGGEITALYASGMSLPRMLRAPLLWGALLTLVAFCLQETIVPRAEQRKYTAVASALLASTGTQHFRYEDPARGTGPLKRVIQAERFDAKTNTLIRPVVQLYDENQKVYLQISAQRGKWDFETDRWKFYNGNITFFPSQERGTFSNNDIFEELEREEVGAESSPAILSRAATTLRQHMENADFEMISLAALSRYRESVRTELLNARNTDEERAAKKLFDGVTFGIHEKIATPLVCLALVLVGAPLGLRPQRSSGSFAMGLSLAVLIIYYIAWTWTDTLGGEGEANPIIMAYAALVIVTIIGLGLVWKKSR